MVVAAFVAPFLAEATTRFVASAAQLPDVRLAVITSEPADRLPPVLREHLAGHWRVDDALDPRQIAEATAGLSRQIGGVERIVAALEQLQVPLAQVREALGIEGMDTKTALNVRDKARMKTVLREAGVPCARHQLVHSAAEATAFAEEVGFPLVAKPPAGAGAQATYRLDEASALQSWLRRDPPAPRHTRSAGGVPRRRGALVRQRDDRRPDRVGVGGRLPPAAAGGAAQPVDAVDRAAAA